MGTLIFKRQFTAEELADILTSYVRFVQRPKRLLKELEANNARPTLQFHVHIMSDEKQKPDMHIPGVESLLEVHKVEDGDGSEGKPGSS